MASSHSIYPKLANPFPSSYEEFIHRSRYARWVDAEQRRETWDETVERLVTYYQAHTYNSIADNDPVWQEVYSSIHQLETLPSMRALMTAGPALDRCHVPAYNCFTANEQFVTPEGYKSFGDTVGNIETVLCEDGQWREATVQSFGKQPTQIVTFRPTQSRSSVRKVVHTTPDHRWITKDRGIVSDLRVGDAVPSQTVKNPFILEAFIRGFGFGDGTLDNRGNAIIRLCGDKDLRWVDRFQEAGATVSYYPYLNGDAMCRFKQGQFADWKELPYDHLDDPSYLSSWLEGYFEADCSYGEQPTLSSQNQEALDFVEHIAPLCGKIATGRSVEKSLQTNFGTRSAPLGKIVLREEAWFYVTSIEEAEDEEVYCVVEPETETFTLASGILTKNCAYLPVDSPRSFDEAMYILLS